MEGARQDEVVVGADLVEAALVKGPVVNQATGLVYYDEGEDSPGDLSTLVSWCPLTI
jgi:hypothetical protein